MRRCLALAENGRGKVGINPMVGAVLVRDDAIIAEAFHEGFGRPHAEQSLLERLHGEVRPGDVLCVNLEPCCHYGKTPPCTEAIIAAGVRHVVFGMEDPNLLVCGKGIAMLRGAGIEVIGPVLPVECRRLNRGFVTLHEQGRPWVTLKQAQTTDGRIAREDGSPLKITSAAQDAWSHEMLRARHDALLVGVDTIIRDKPQLDVRAKNKELVQPVPVILDPHGRLPPDSAVLREGTIIVTQQHAGVHTEQCRSVGAANIENPAAPFQGAADFKQKGIRIFAVPMRGSVFHWPALWHALTTPADGYHGITSILVEGGPRTWEAFRRAGCRDQEVVLVGMEA